MDGYATIIKNYGPMHFAYLIYIFLYFLLIVGTVVYAIKIKKITSTKYIMALMTMGLINVSIWFIEQFTNNRIEYLAVSYVFNEIIVVWMYNRLIKEGLLDTFIVRMKFSSEEAPEKIIDIEVGNSDNGRLVVRESDVHAELANLSDDRLHEIIRQISASDKLTERETEVAVLLLKNLKRKDMASNLCISEDTVKTHTSHIFSKLDISSRKELQNMAEQQLEHEKGPLK